MNWTKKLKLIWLFSVFLAFGLGLFLHPQILGRSAVILGPVREKSSYQFINPLLGFDIPEEVGLRRYGNLESLISKTINTKRSEGDIESASVYMRKMNSGQWISINENEKFSPASMLKVAVMVAYLKEAESNPNLLRSRTIFSGITDRNAGSFYKPTNVLKEGNYYIIEDLIERMIKYSDNTAHHMLMHNNIFSPESLIKLDSYLDINIRSLEDDTKDFMSTETYSNFFRILYNATYLSRSMSEKALSILANSDFRDGLVAQLPPQVVVAHKFGERTILSEKDYKRELHDCGIVYYPEHPYFICVMTKGKDFQKLSSFISDISKMVLEHINSEYGTYK